MAEFPMPPELPPEPRPVKVDILIEAQDGARLYSFTTDNTLVRTFGERWQHMNYIWQSEPGFERPRIVLGFHTLEQYLIANGFVEVHAEEPTSGDKVIYLEYGRQVIERQLGGSALQGGDGE